MRPTQLALALNLAVKVHPMFSVAVYLMSGGVTINRYLPMQQETSLGFALL